MRLRHILVLAGVVAVGVIAAAQPAAATPPAIERVSFPLSFEVPCEGFTQLVDLWGTVTATVHFDKEGNPVRLVVHTKFDGTDTNSVTGKTVRIHHNWIETRDLAAGTVTVTGIPLGVWADRGGPVLYVVGRQVFLGEVGPPGPIFSAGRDNFQGDFGRFCEVLA